MFKDVFESVDGVGGWVCGWMGVWRGVGGCVGEGIGVGSGGVCVCVCVGGWERGLGWVVEGGGGGVHAPCHAVGHPSGVVFDGERVPLHLHIGWSIDESIDESMNG